MMWRLQLLPKSKLPEQVNNYHHCNQGIQQVHLKVWLGVDRTEQEKFAQGLETRDWKQEEHRM